MSKKPITKGKARKPTKASVKAAADRAEARAKGKPVEPACTDLVLSPQEVKRKRGRPTKYDPAFCDLVVEMGEKGKSKTQIASGLGVLTETMTEWAKRYPEFSAALKEAEQLSQTWWENQGQLGMFLGAKGFNATAFIFQMKNRFRHDYSDKFEVKHDGTAAFLACLKKMNGAAA